MPNGNLYKGGQTQMREISQQIIDQYNQLLGRIKRHEERLDSAKDELAVMYGLFPELKPTVEPMSVPDVTEERFEADKEGLNDIAATAEPLNEPEAK